MLEGCLLGVRVGHTGRGHTHRGSASRWDGSSRNLPAVFGLRHRDAAEKRRGPIHLEPDTAQRCLARNAKPEEGSQMEH